MESTDYTTIVRFKASSGHGGEGATSTSPPLKPKSGRGNFFTPYVTRLHDWCGEHWFLACMIYLFFVSAILLGYFHD